MTIIVVTQDFGLPTREFAAAIAAGLGLDLVSQRQLGDLVAQRMRIDAGRLERLVARPPSLFDRWTAERRRLAWHTGEEIAKLAEHGNVVVESWSPTGSLDQLTHGIRVHIGRGPRLADATGPRDNCRATIAAIDPARPWTLAAPRDSQIVCELVLLAAPRSVADCVHELKQLTLRPSGRDTSGLLGSL